MNIRTECLKKACDKLSIPYRFIDKYKNFVEVTINDRPFFFISNITPFSNSTERLVCLDKGHSYELMHEYITMPKTFQYLFPGVKEVYNKYKEFFSIGEIVSDIKSKLPYPLIVKRNRGSCGNNVYSCNNDEEARNALETIYKNTSRFDYIALAQEKINIKKEYRVVIFDKKIAFVYDKSTDGATFNGNLSPLHWKDSRAIPVKDQDLIAKINEFIKPVYEKFGIVYSGLDIAVDENDKLWLIEMNSQPGFALFIHDNGDEEVVFLYEKMLSYLARKNL